MRMLLAALTLLAFAAPSWAQDTSDLSPESILNMVVKSGPIGIGFMTVLGLFSLVAVAIIIERLFALTRNRVVPPAFANDLRDLARGREDDPERFRELAEGLRLTDQSLAALQGQVPDPLLAKLRPLSGRPFGRAGFLDELGKLAGPDVAAHGQELLRHARPCPRLEAPIAAVLRAGMLRAGRPVPEVEKTMEDALAREVSVLRGRIRPLNIIASVAPLIGLLGTIVGILLAFRTASETGLKAEALAEGIYLALLTTAAGLLIAIPTLLVVAYFNNKIDRYMRETDELLMDVIPCFARMEGQSNGHAREPQQTETLVAAAK